MATLNITAMTNSTASEWEWQIEVAVDPSGYIYTSGKLSGGRLGAWTYAPSTNTLTRRATYQSGNSNEWSTFLSANYRGVAEGFWSNNPGFRVWTFNGTALTLKASNTVGVGSPYLDVGGSFRNGVDSDDLLIGQNQSGKILTFTWDGSTTVTTGVNTTGSVSYSRLCSSNANYGLISGYSSNCAWYTWGVGTLTKRGNFGAAVDRSHVYMSPYIDRAYACASTSSLLCYDLTDTTATSVWAPTSPVTNYHAVWEDSNNVIWTVGTAGIAAYTYSGTTYTLAGTYALSGCQRIMGDNNGYLFVTCSDKKLYVLKAEWVSKNALIGGQYY